MKHREEALKLVRQAFEKAERKSGRHPTSMGLPVLKNRLLSITDRAFTTNRYGAHTLVEFVNGLHPELSFVEGSNLLVLDATAESVTPLDAIVDVPGTHETWIVAGRIRADLWRALMDYASGRSYVWDPATKRAREMRADDALTAMPTVTPQEVALWRRDFIESQKGSLDQSELVLAQQWQEQGLSTQYLPRQIQTKWNRVLNQRVKERLECFLATLGSERGGDVAQPEARQEDMQGDIQGARDRGDGYSVGALKIALAERPDSAERETLLAQAVACWATPTGFLLEPNDFKELSAQLEGVEQAKIAIALINVIPQDRDLQEELKESLDGFVYGIRAGFKDAFGADDKSPASMFRVALAKYQEHMAQATASVSRFQNSTPVTAKIASVDLLKAIAKAKRWMVAEDQQLANDMTVLLGPAFRKLCEAYERNVDADVIRRAPEYLRNVERQKLREHDPRRYSRIWHEIASPVIEHLTTLVEEASLRGEAALAPVLALRNANTKADLIASTPEVQLSFSLVNSGKGAAHAVRLREVAGPHVLTCIDPAYPFDMPPGSERLVKLSLRKAGPSSEVEIPIEWQCETSAEKGVSFEETIRIGQQKVVPDWDALVKGSPYGINPIDRPDRLYGRASTLRALQYAAMARTSHFVWGQKRIGKTSVLQVLNKTLEKSGDAVSVLLRMGELTSLHEGQIAWLIATRLARQVSGVVVPEESEFGASLGRLIPFVDELVRAFPEKKWVVIIDEFDDLDPSLYTGERGKQFVKALRSVSEVGLTFFFVGSERMDAIFSRHQSDLNKWINERLDRIESRDDCRALITEPLAGSIEFSSEAIDFIIDYAAGNPFYIHNICYQLLLRCLKELRTYIDVNDAHAVRQELLRSLGPTNFAHFWEDNPVLDSYEKVIQSGENCIALCCIASLGGRFESIDEVVQAQDELGLNPEERASERVLRDACGRLMKRKIIRLSESSGLLTISLPLFREWLGQNSLNHLLPIWNEARQTPKPKRQGVRRERAGRDDAPFVIAEDELLAVAQRLLIYGKQKDVAEIRTWLRQFDDDGRIEMAFALLKRLAERGFINDGMRAVGFNRMAEMIEAHRNALGQNPWTIVKARRDNLAVAYLDAEHKSGATTAREVSRIAQAGKIGPAGDMALWMKQHENSLPLLIIADDFAGTGGTLVKGLQKMRAKIPPELWSKYVSTGRLVVLVMYAFSEALDALRHAFPELQVFASQMLGDDLRACDERAGIFETEAERRFAVEVLTQIGRELSQSHPLGHGDMAALVVMHNTTPNNSLPIFWCSGTVAERPWKALFPRG